MTVENPKKKRFKDIPDLGSGIDDYYRDYNAILYSHAFRRLRHKTQVFFFPDNDHICTRLDHSLYVSTIAEIIANNLSEKGVYCDPLLARTIGISHDLGHAPFGHAGETVLNSLAKDIGGFKHEIQSLRIVDKIEKPDANKPVIGLNLCQAVRDGIVNHCGEDPSTEICPSDSPDLSGGSSPFTIEGCIVKLVDKVAYLGRDLEDAIIYEIIKEADIPAGIQGIIGTKNGEIVDYFVADIIENSDDKAIRLSEKASALMKGLMKYSVKEIYRHEKLETYKKRVEDVITTLYNHFFQILEEKGDNISEYAEYKLDSVKIFGGFIGKRSILYFDEEQKKFSNNSLLNKRIVIDFLSTLTDNYVFQACSEFFLPRLDPQND
jgi:dGTPase